MTSHYLDQWWLDYRCIYASLGLNELRWSQPCLQVFWWPGGCFTNVSQALQNNLAKIHNTRNHIYGENFKLELCTCAQSMALGTRTKFQLEILITSTISAIHKFRENSLESSWNVSETTPRSNLKLNGFQDEAWTHQKLHHWSLTHWGPNKMAAISQTFSNAFSWMKMLEFWFKFHWSLFLRFEFTILHTALVQIMAWRWLGDKPLSEPTMVWFTDAYMCH